MGAPVINRNNAYLTAPDFKVEKNWFDLSHIHARDMEIGKLYPVALFRTMPGDNFKCKVDMKGYMESLMKNGFYNFRLNLRAYYMRISDIDPVFEGILTGGPDGDFDEVLPTIELISKGDFKQPYHNLQDCFGLPISNLDLQKFPIDKRFISSLPYIMYDCIYFNHYIDDIIEDNIVNYIYSKPVRKKAQNIRGLVDNDRKFYTVGKKYYRMFDSPINFRSFLSTHGYPEVLDTEKYSFQDLLHFIYNVNYVKDRYTSAKLSEQLGTAPSLAFDLSTAFDFSKSSGDIVLGQIGIQDNNVATFLNPLNSTGNNTKNVNLSVPTTLNGTVVMSPGNMFNANWNTYFNNALQQSISSVPIRDIRLAFQTQLIQESIMFGGWSYYQYIKTFFGVDIKDRIPYRPRYVGGVRKSFIVNDIYSTVATSSSPLGDYAGRGSIDTDDMLFETFAEDFGYIMVVAYIDTDGCFYNSQGVAKEWLDIERFNFPNPAFYHLSMQGIRDSELYVSSASKTLYSDIFGFQGIYNEWRQKNDYVSGSLRDELSFWHSARIFDSKPNLNSEFLKVKQKDYDRIFSVKSDLYKPFIMAFGFSCAVERNMPSFPLPGLIDHR